MERLTEKITDKRTGEVLAYRAKYLRDGEAVQKLGRLEDLEEQGKLLELPCAVGDKIYLPNKYVGKVINFDITEVCIFADEIIFVTDWENEYSLDDFGKTVFATEKEAEAALKEIENKETQK